MARLVTAPRLEVGVEQAMACAPWVLRELKLMRERGRSGPERELLEDLARLAAVGSGAVSRVRSRRLRHSETGGASGGMGRASLPIASARERFAQAGVLLGIRRLQQMAPDLGGRKIGGALFLEESRVTEEIARRTL